MINSDCLRILATLSKEEFKKFQLFVGSPIYSRSKAVQILIGHLCKTWELWHPIFLELTQSPMRKNVLMPTLEKEIGKGRLHTLIYPEKPYNDQNLRKAQSDTYKLAEQFIKQCLTTETPVEEIRQSLRLQHFFLDRGAEKLFLKGMKHIEKSLASPSYLNSSYYHLSAQVAELMISYDIRIGKRKDHFPEWALQFDRYFVLTKLRQYSGMKARQKVHDQEYDYFFMDEVLNNSRTEKKFQVPMIQIWYHIVRLEQPDCAWNSFSQLQQLLKLHTSKIEKQELRMIYASMINFLAKENRRPGLDLRKELFAVFKEMVQSKAIYIEDKINSGYFNACVRAAMKAEAHEWAEDFIYDHSDRLLGPNPKELVDYSLLLLLFERQEYPEVLKRIGLLRFSDEKKAILKRILQLQTFYETEASEDFFRLCDSLIRYIRNKKEIGRAMKSHFRNFVRSLHLIGRYRFNLKPIKPELRGEIQQIQMAERNWLLEKLNELDPHPDQ